MNTSAMASLKSTFVGPFRRCLVAAAGLKLDPKARVIQTVMRAINQWHLPRGDYLEFGVYQGRSFSYAMKYAREQRLRMKFYAFDSFEGLPEVDTRFNPTAVFGRGQWACGEKEFREGIKRRGENPDLIITVPGFYSETLNDQTKSRLGISRAAFVWIDCDVYESTVPVLSFIVDYLTTGSFIAFDEWFSYGADPEAGEMKAVREWLQFNPDVSLMPYAQYGLSGMVFLVRKGRVLRPEDSRLGTLAGVGHVIC